MAEVKDNFTPSWSR